jgi:hypothetical protein
MTILDEIYAALLASDSADLPAIKKYVTWVQFRRRVNNHFYTRAHWIQRPAIDLCRPASFRGSAHWIRSS